MEGIVAEGTEMIEEEADDEVKDAGLISAAQRVEHCEMAGYGTARAYAELLGDHEGARLLQSTLDEERQTDEKLSKLAKSAINVAAVK
jgi:ferritin-like metal-binding protein YciE